MLDMWKPFNETQIVTSLIAQYWTSDSYNMSEFKGSPTRRFLGHIY